MASLAHASSDFVDALRRGLEAYDAGNNKKLIVMMIDHKSKINCYSQKFIPC